MFFINALTRLKELPDLIEQSGQHEKLKNMEESCGRDFPGSNYHPSRRKNWMDGLDPTKLKLKDIVWPGTHDSATNGMGADTPLISQPLAECQSLTIYEQLERGTRVLDIRVEQNRLICHGMEKSYSVDVVLDDVNSFLSETRSEILILEFRTEHGYENPPEFDKFLVQKLGDYLIYQDDGVFEKTVSELLPKRVICIWKPQGGRTSNNGDPLWGPEYLKDNWIDTDKVRTKFESNLKHLADQPAVSSRKFFYRVEHTLTCNSATVAGDIVDKMMNLKLTSSKFGKNTSVKGLADQFRPYSRLFIKQCFERNIIDRLQIFSTDYIEDDFVDACVGLTHARIEGKA